MSLSKLGALFGHLGDLDEVELSDAVIVTPPSTAGYSMGLLLALTYAA